RLQAPHANRGEDTARGDHQATEDRHHVKVLAPQGIQHRKQRDGSDGPNPTLHLRPPPTAATKYSSNAPSLCPTSRISPPCARTQSNPLRCSPRVSNWAVSDPSGPFSTRNG